MICFDTNIIIYLAKGDLGEDIIGDTAISYPSIARIEALGFHDIRSVEEQNVRALLATLTEIPLANSVIERAISLRQQCKMTLADAIVAATAMDNDAELYTANIRDFSGIDGLRIHNPFDVSQ